MNEKQRQYLISSIILGALAVALAAYYWMGLAGPDIEQTNTRIAKVEGELRELQAKLSEYNRFLAQKDEIERAVEAIALATERNEQQLVVAMRDFIAKTGVDMSSLTPMKSNDYTEWREFPYELGGVTRYMDYVQFLSLVEQNADFFMRVKEFTIKNDEDQPTVHPFNLTISSFTWRE
jgi:Tfp pilus assembly protein PilO